MNVIKHDKMYFICADEVELSDETGNLKNLQGNPGDYGTEYFADREILILLKAESKLFQIT